MKPPERFPPDDAHNASRFFAVQGSPAGALAMEETHGNAHRAFPKHVCAFNVCVSSDSRAFPYNCLRSS